MKITYIFAFQINNSDRRKLILLIFIYKLISRNSKAKTNSTLFLRKKKIRKNETKNSKIEYKTYLYTKSNLWINVCLFIPQFNKLIR